MALSTPDLYLEEMKEEDVINLAYGDFWYLREDINPLRKKGLLTRNYWLVSAYCHGGRKPLVSFDLYRAASAPVLEVAKGELVQWVLGAKKLICKLLERVKHIDAASEARIQELELALDLVMRSKSGEWGDFMTLSLSSERDSLVRDIPAVLEYIHGLEDGLHPDRPEALAQWETIYRQRTEALGQGAGNDSLPA